ncbi:hypothetical protein [Maribacter polysaccharolyticus]|uniref:hypothetical protein n=1 Tax=Maribacter polysaccharolyticus TaxID=3020831 RepID=UPI00237EF3F4|nr:hypothetical protein [Maribacter polysaccharolyticus]MDE3740753.1 hypothetical protein [Maribacter polysaccharolyticus]
MKKADNHKNFKTPEGYFEGFTDRLLDRIATNESPEKGSVLPKSDGFGVPDNYFEELNAKIKAKLDQDETKVIKLNPRRNYLYYAAASIAVLVLLTIGIRISRTTEPTFESLAKSDIEDYFESSDFGFSTYEIAEVLPIDDLEVSDILENQFADEYIIDYLDENLENFEELNLLNDD